MISSDVIRGYIDTILLSLLLEGDSYGYAISKEIAGRSGGGYTIKETTLYSAMARLEKRGLVHSYYGDESFGRRRTYYHITPDGQDYYRARCAEWRQTRELMDRFTGEEKRDAADQ